MVQRAEGNAHVCQFFYSQSVHAGQFRRDLTLPFALWNLVFRTIVNIGHNLFAVSRMAGQSNCEGVAYDGKDFRDAAIVIVRGLDGMYTAPSDATLPVNGDLSKVRMCEAVIKNPTARAMLDSLQSTMRKIPGKQEVNSTDA